jgi:hypothetical protein
MKTRIVIILALVSIALFSFSFSSRDAKENAVKSSTGNKETISEPAGGFVSDEIKR